jgi:SPP1 family predicted phage head-tail adaptor
MIDAGTLRHRIQIQRKVAGSDDGYRPRYDWQTIATVWAEVAPTTGTERERDDGIVTEQRYRIKMRHNPELRRTDRILHRGEAIDLTSVIDIDGLRRITQAEGFVNGE